MHGQRQHPACPEWHYRHKNMVIAFIKNNIGCPYISVKCGQGLFCPYRQFVENPVYPASSSLNLRVHGTDAFTRTKNVIRIALFCHYGVVHSRIFRIKRQCYILFLHHGYILGNSNAANSYHTACK